MNSILIPWKELTTKINMFTKTKNKERNKAYRVSFFFSCAEKSWLHLSLQTTNQKTNPPKTMKRCSTRPAKYDRDHMGEQRVEILGKDLPRPRWKHRIRRSKRGMSWTPKTITRTNYQSVLEVQKCRNKFKSWICSHFTTL